MNEKEKLIRSYMDWYKQEQLNRSGCGGPTLMACFILLLFLLTGCRSIQYVPVETVKVEYVTKTDSFIKKDSVYIRDSIFTIQKGDTVTINKLKYIYKDRWQEIVKVDTVIKTDSVAIPYPVEKQLSKWEKIKMDFGGTAICLSIALLLIVLGIRIIKKFYK